MARGKIIEIQRNGKATAEYDDGSTRIGHIDLIPGGGMRFVPVEVWNESVEPLPEPPSVKRVVAEANLPGA
jgi:hypothetical protein